MRDDVCMLCGSYRCNGECEQDAPEVDCDVAAADDPHGAWVDFVDDRKNIGASEAGFKGWQRRWGGKANTQISGGTPSAESDCYAGDCTTCGGPVFHREGKPGEYDHECRQHNK